MKELLSNRKHLLIFIISIFVSAINFNLLLKPLNIVCGGSGGLALVIEKISFIKTSDTIALIYVGTVILSMILLEKKRIASIMLASALYPTFIYLTENISNAINLNYSDMLLICIIAGIIAGITNGIAYRFGYSPGGLGVIAPIFNRFFKTSVSLVNFIVNTIVVLLGAYYFGFNMVVYAIVLLYIDSFVCNLIILGLSNNKVIVIHSKENDKIMEVLHDKYCINVMILDDVKNQKTLLAVIKDIDYNSVKLDLRTIDRKVFFTTNNCYEVGK
jgi:uncharacterized membrane-anchored protein YitT (DUF2179 family)